MAKPGQQNKLRDAGVLPIQYTRVACNYPGKTIAFRVDLGSNPNYISVVVEFEDGDGDLAHVDLKEASSKTNKQWRAMQRSWGAVWKLDAGSQLKPPFSIRLTSEYSGQTLVVRNVIPNGWRPGATYRSLVNYL
ncbi:Expansin-B15 like [Actinidia chinensis var. chinensis]|uniref:Expansin-B15 like n=1 Tax=Actinidia chinensis var. chinensis TaxID=1590841 RepID=A0A2R6RT50_ACTCC|nr:Expansin-B15 like [Actinidia chinensis var. chinensis]